MPKFKTGDLVRVIKEPKFQRRLAVYGNKWQISPMRERIVGRVFILSSYNAEHERWRLDFPGNTEGNAITYQCSVDEIELVETD